MTPGSLKAKLLLGISLCMVLLVIAGGLTVYLYCRAYLFAELDHALYDKLRFLRASCVQDGKDVRFELTEAVWRRVQDEHDPEFFQLWRAGSGETLHQSWESFPGDLPDVGAGSREPVYANLILPSGMEGRVAGQTFYPAQAEKSATPIAVHVAVAHDTNRIREALAELRRLTLLAGAISSGLVLVAAFTIVTRNLRPLTELSRQIDAVPIGAEKARFALPDAPNELDPVVERLNALMDRVDAALENERQFTANAAHELRNPLAGMRSQLELALSKARDPEDYRKALSGVLDIEKRLEAMVGNLLLLTRLQAGQDEIAMSDFSIPDLLRHTWKPFFKEAEKKDLTVSLKCDSELTTMTTSRDFLEIVLRNLFDNAVSYTNASGRIQIRASGNTNRVELRVENTNPGLRTDEVEKMFGRFWRASKAREGDHLHAGIGLTLTEKVVAALGGEIEARLNGNGMVEVGVVLPGGAHQRAGV